MKISDAGIKLIKEFEGCVLHVYLDAVGIPTCGVGHVIRSLPVGTKITQAQADAFLKSDLARFEANVNKFDPIYHWTQNEFDALVCFAFNVGSIDGLTSNGTRSKAVIADKMLAYNKAGGKVLKGLTRRREAERSLFLQGGAQTMHSTLKYGSRGAEVKYLQHRLNEMKIRGGNLAEDGIFGTVTKLAVIELQAQGGITKDGIVGKNTWQLVER